MFQFTLILSIYSYTDRVVETNGSLILELKVVLNFEYYVEWFKNLKCIRYALAK